MADYQWHSVDCPRWVKNRLDQYLRSAMIHYNVLHYYEDSDYDFYYDVVVNHFSQRPAQIKGKHYQYRGTLHSHNGASVFWRVERRKCGESGEVAMRERATVLCVRDDKFLAVKEQDRNDWSLPGGGIEKGEQAIVAAIRELEEETGLRTQSIQYLTNFAGRRANHHIFLIVPRSGNLHLQHNEIAKAEWLPMETSSDREFQGHVAKSLEAWKRNGG